MSLADKADRHALYQQTVQTPKKDVKFLYNTYLDIFRHKPTSLREDFCGTALLAVEWVKADYSRIATGVDIDEETIEWGRKNNVESENVADRVTLIRANVMECALKEKFHVICAFNFSTNFLKQRDMLVQYFSKVKSSLRKDGIFVMDVCGGSEMIIRLKTKINFPTFEYTFEQKSFDPINNEQAIGIHFKFPDGSQLLDAFSFSWRLWGLPELRESLQEAGFRSIRVWWSDVLPDMASEFKEIVDIRPMQSKTWYAYVVAINDSNVKGML
jgi:SAM-dependent methyltransferase